MKPAYVLREDGKNWRDATVLPSGLYGVAVTDHGDIAVLGFTRGEFGPYFDLVIALGRASDETYAAALDIVRRVDSEEIAEAEIFAVYTAWYNRRWNVAA